MDWSGFRVHKRFNLNPQNMEKIYSTLFEIDGVKNSWRITRQLLPQTIERLTKPVIITLIGASNRIEGNKLSESLTGDIA